MLRRLMLFSVGTKYGYFDVLVKLCFPQIPLPGPLCREGALSGAASGLTVYDCHHITK